MEQTLVPIDGDALAFEGRRFGRLSSFFWDSAGRPSVGHRWLAVLSYGSPRQISSPDFGFIDFFPPWRRMSIAIYEVASGRMVGNIQGWACDLGVAVFDEAAWFDDSLFAMPIEPGGQSFVLCGFPANGKGI